MNVPLKLGTYKRAEYYGGGGTKPEKGLLLISVAALKICR